MAAGGVVAKTLVCRPLGLTPSDVVTHQAATCVKYKVHVATMQTIACYSEPDMIIPSYTTGPLFDVKVQTIFLFLEKGGFRGRQL